jgi:hypothetical protein
MAQNRIIKSFTLDVEVAAWLEEQARSENRNFSNFMETWILREKDKLENAFEEPAEVRP